MKLDDLPLHTVIITREGRRLRIVEHKAESTLLELVGHSATQISIPRNRQFSFYLESEVASKPSSPKPVFYSKGYSKAICEALLDGAEILSDIIDKAYKDEFGNRQVFANRVISKLYDLKVRGVIKKEGKSWKLVGKELLRYRE